VPQTSPIKASMVNNEKKECPIPWGLDIRHSKNVTGTGIETIDESGGTSTSISFCDVENLEYSNVKIIKKNPPAPTTTQATSSPSLAINPSCNFMCIGGVSIYFTIQIVLKVIISISVILMVYAKIKKLSVNLF